MKRKSNIFTVMKKELFRFFGDRRMLLTLILPGLLIYTIYSFMGGALTEEMSRSNENMEYRVLTFNMSDTVRDITLNSGLNISYYQCPDCNEEHDADTIAEAINEGGFHAYLVFPESFDQDIAVYDPAGGLAAPEVKIYYNSSDADSMAAYSSLLGMLNVLESSMANRFDVNVSQDHVFDVATEEDLTGMLFSMLMPMLLVMLTFSGCMAIAPESIAGEKERGTIATLLVTPLRRSELAIGKIAAISIISLLGGMCSFLGVILSLPKLVGGEELGMMDASIYGVGDYLWILSVILSTVLLFVSIISVLSALAKSVKEATSMVSPIMLLVMLVGVTGMFSGGAVSSFWYLIPVYNSVQCISGIFSMSYEPMNVIITMITNLVISGLMVAILTKMFSSEKIMFNK